MRRRKAIEVAQETRGIYLPWIANHYGQRYPAVSVRYPDSSAMTVDPNMKTNKWPRVAVMEGDQVDIALSWSESEYGNSQRTQIPVVNMANEGRPGGDWESGLIAPEECLARRSNLVHALRNPSQNGMHDCPVAHYPIPPKGGMYSPWIGTRIVT